MTFSCVLLHEDILIRQTLEEYISALPGIILSGSYSDLDSARSYLNYNTADVLFADIHLKEIVAVQKNSFMQPPPMFVFITKDPADANIGFELDAVDCLLQPFSFQRFLKTTEKIERRISASVQKLTAVHAQPELQYCFVKTDQNFVKVEFQKICYVEGVENYIRIYCENKTVMALNTMKNIETALSSHHFLRIHRSYIVNLDKVERILNHNFYVGEKVLPIGKSYRKPITDILKQSYTIGC